jgi:hypothetical protein
MIIQLPRLLALGCFVVALVCAASPTTVLGAGWYVWTSAGLIAWVGEPLLNRITTTTS